MRHRMERCAAGVLAAAVGCGVMLADLTAEAVPTISLSYEDGASSEYNFRMKREERIHEENMQTIEFEFRCDGDQEKYDRAMRAEQKRHNEALNAIEHDYSSGTPWH